MCEGGGMVSAGGQRLCGALEIDVSRESKLPTCNPKKPENLSLVSLPHPSTPPTSAVQAVYRKLILQVQAEPILHQQLEYKEATLWQIPPSPLLLSNSQHNIPPHCSQPCFACGKDWRACELTPFSSPRSIPVDIVFSLFYLSSHDL